MKLTTKEKFNALTYTRYWKIQVLLPKIRQRVSCATRRDKNKRIKNERSRSFVCVTVINYPREPVQGRERKQNQRTGYVKQVALLVEFSGEVRFSDRSTFRNTTVRLTDLPLNATVQLRNLVPPLPSCLREMTPFVSMNPILKGLLLWTMLVFFLVAC